MCKFISKCIGTPASLLTPFYVILSCLLFLFHHRLMCHFTINYVVSQIKHIYSQPCTFSKPNFTDYKNYSWVFNTHQVKYKKPYHGCIVWLLQFFSVTFQSQVFKTTDLLRSHWINPSFSTFHIFVFWWYFQRYSEKHNYFTYNYMKVIVSSKFGKWHIPHSSYEDPDCTFA